MRDKVLRATEGPIEEGIVLTWPMRISMIFSNMTGYLIEPQCHTFA